MILKEPKRMYQKEECHHTIPLALCGMQHFVSDEIFFFLNMRLQLLTSYRAVWLNN